MAALPFYGATGKFTWRMGALVARALAAASGDPRANTDLLVGSGLAVLCLVAAGLMRTPFGVTLGWLIEVATFLSAAVLPMMLAVGVIFTLLWVVCLWQGRRIDDIQAARAAEAGH